jgi:hypothetical protein
MKSGCSIGLTTGKGFQRSFRLFSFIIFREEMMIENDGKLLFYSYLIIIINWFGIIHNNAYNLDNLYKFYI